MRVPHWLPAAGGLIGVSAAVLFLAEAGYLGPRPTMRDVNVNVEARQFAFSPAVIEVHQGDHVRLNLQSIDVTHGIYLDSYGVEAMAQPGQSQAIDFVADRAGSYRFRCSATCGPLHPFMIGELTVLPASSLNPGPFVATAVLAAVVAIGAVASVWRPSHSREMSYG